MTDALETAGDIALPDELTVLKQRAKLLGVTFSNNISVDTLRERIRAHQEGLKPVEENLEANPLADGVKAKMTLRQQLQAEQMKLIRVRITCMDPKKADIPGEIFTVANEYLGTVRKYVPFGELTDDGWHIPYCIYTMMDARKFQNIRTIKDRRTGHTRVEANWAKEFAIEILPPLTAEELADLKKAALALN